MKHLTTIDLIKQISKDEGVSVNDTNLIIQSVFEFIKVTIEEETDKINDYYPTIGIPGFGMFYVKNGAKPYIKKNLKKIKSNESI